MDKSTFINPKFRFSIDRGGTFTDIVYTISDDNNPEIKTSVYKLLSESDEYKDAPLEGIRRIINSHLNIQNDGKIDSK